MERERALELLGRCNEALARLRDEELELERRRGPLEGLRERLREALDGSDDLPGSEALERWLDEHGC